MGLFKQLMIFGKTGLQGLPTRVNLSLWAFSRQGASGVPLFTTWDSVSGSGRAPIPGNISGRSDPGSELSHLVLACHCSAKPERPRPGEVWTWAAMDSGSRITGGGSGYAALLAHAGGALYGTELGSVTLKRISFFCFPNKHSTHTGTFFWRTQKESCKGLVSVTLKINSQHTPQ